MAAVVVLDERAVLWRLLQAQCLLEPVATVCEACDRCAGLPGAVPSGLLALAARVVDFEPDALEEAVFQRAVVRVPAMRGAMYLLPPEWMADGLALAGAGAVVSSLGRQGIDGNTYRAVTDAVECALAGALLTGPEIRDALAEAGRVPPGPPEALVLVLRAMGHEGRIVRAASRGSPRSQRFEYALVEDWMGRSLSIPKRAEALARLAPWYLDAHGPSTAADFAWWAGVSVRAAQEALEEAEGRILPVTGAEQPQYATEGSLQMLEAAPERWSCVRLLPHWDPYLMGHFDRSCYLDPRWSRRVVDRNGNPTNILVVDGRVMGVWDYSGDEIQYACFGGPIGSNEVAGAAACLAGVLGDRPCVERSEAQDLHVGGQGAFMAPLAAAQSGRRPRPGGSAQGHQGRAAGRPADLGASAGGGRPRGMGTKGNLERGAIMEETGLLLDAFGRVQEGLHRYLPDLTEDELTREPHPPIGWLAWRLTRVSDSNFSRLVGLEQLWIADGWHAKFNMEPNPADFGRAQTHTREQVLAFRASADLLLAYHDVVFARGKAYLESLKPSDLGRELDEPQFQPLPTVGVRLVSVLENSFHNMGQIAYLRAFHRVGGWFPRELAAT